MHEVTTWWEERSSRNLLRRRLVLPREATLIKPSRPGKQCSFSAASGSTTWACPRKGKPTVRRGRKAMGPGVPEPWKARLPKGESVMSRLAKFAVDFLKRDDGPTAVEYAVMLALIIVVCITAITTLGGNANQVFSNVALNTAVGTTGS